MAKKTLLIRTRRKIRRGWGGKKRNEISFSILACNANGLKGKFESLKNCVNYFKPSCILIQESKLKNTGSHKLNGYQIFELNRDGGGGGLFTAIDENLSPVLIRTGEGKNEIIVIQIKLAGFNVRIINAYGPQESAQKDQILDFWYALEKEILDAKDENCGILLEMDANAKLGPNIVQGDPNEMSENGVIMFNVVKRHNLIIANTSKKCNGTITRHRVTKEKEEKSILDYVIFCEKMEPYFHEMLIDEPQNHILTKYVTTKGAIKYIKSDHNVLFANFNLQYNRRKATIKKELFNFKNKEDQQKFFQFTSKTKQFTSCFENRGTFDEKSNKFFKTLDDAFHASFKKIRIKTKSTKIYPTEIQAQLDSINLLKLSTNSAKCPTQKKKLEFKLKEAENRVTTMMADENAKFVKEQMKELNSIDGNFNQARIWKMKNKLLPRPKDPPMAKKDKGGNLISAPLPLKRLYIETYRERLSHRPIKSEFKDIYLLKTKLWELRYEDLRSIKSSPWTLTNLNKAIMGLKINQSGDPSGIISELFKPGVLGQDLARGLVMLCNGMKTELFIPALVQLANITTIYKNKGSRLDLTNDRGIFILSIFRKIVDKMIYQDKYEKIDNFMSDSNIGARRKRNIRYHLFVIFSGTRKFRRH